MAVWYIRDNAPTSTIGWSAVTTWSNHTATAGELIRQATTPTVGNERVFVAIVGGATGSTEPTWTVTKGARNTSSSATYQECTGQPAVNGDLTNTPLSSTVRSIAQALGKIITDNSGTHIFICSTLGTPGSGEPTYNTSAVGNTTTDGTATWTYIGTSFSAWAAPFARITSSAVSTWGAAGDTFYIGDDHTETQSTSNTISIPGTAANPNFFYSIDHTASLPPGTSAYKAGASVATTSSGAITIATGSVEFEGITFSCGSSSNGPTFTIANNAGTWVRYINCTLKSLGTVTNVTAYSFNAASFVDLVNTTIQFGAAGSSLSRGAGSFRWRNTPSAIQGGTLPTTLIAPSNTASGETVLEGVDLLALGSGKTIVGAPAADYAGSFSLLDCQLGSGVTVATTPLIGYRVDLYRSDSSATNYNHQRYHYTGTQIVETTIIRTGGASDNTTGISWKITTTANSRWTQNFECFPTSIWNASTGTNRIVTFYGIWNAAALPNNDDIWPNIQYLGSSSSPLASLGTGTKGNGLAANGAWSSDTSAWDSLAAARQNTHAYSTGDVIAVSSAVGQLFWCTSGGTSSGLLPIAYASAADGSNVTDGTATFRAGVRFAMAVTLSTPQPAMEGYLRGYIKVAKASSTFYIDPAIILSV